MTTAAKITFGNELWMGPSGGSLVKIPELRSVTPPKGNREVLDATTHDSPEGAQEYIASGTYDPGTMNFSINLTVGNSRATRLVPDGQSRYNNGWSWNIGLDYLF